MIYKIYKRGLEKSGDIKSGTKNHGGAVSEQLQHIFGRIDSPVALLEGRYTRNVQRRGASAANGYGPWWQEPHV